MAGQANPGGGPGLSTRGQGLLAGAPMPPYLYAHFERVEDAYDAATNPDGYIGLSVAENKLVWDLVGPRLTEPRVHLPHQAICYDEMIGSEVFRARLGEFMGSKFLGRTFEPANIAVLAGAGSVLEILFYVLADPGEAVLVPTPSYSGFWADLETRNELHIIPVHTSSASGFRLDTELLDRTLAEADRPVRALLYTNPSNPTGAVASAEEIEQVISWAETNDLHLVLDEVYALSIHGRTQFVSGATLRPSLGDNIHVVWAFSKDFGSSGLRCGVLVTENEFVMQAVDALAYWAVVSGDTQHVLGEMIADERWVNTYLAEMQEGLRRACASVTAALDDAGIDYMPPEGGYFLLCDLREHLDEPTWEAEERLWRRLLEEANVNITPGAACRNSEPGFMRICFAAASTEAAVEAVRRLGKVLTPKSGRISAEARG